MRINPTNPVIYEYDSGHQTRLSTVVRTLSFAAARGENGITARELGRYLWPNDTSGKSRAGSPLTKLHKEGRLEALEAKREGHHIYVLPVWVNDRQTWEGYRHRGHCATCTCDDLGEGE